MTISSDAIAPAKRLPAQIALDPVYNNLNSLALVNLAGRRANIGEWPVGAAAAMTPALRRTHQLLFDGLPDLLTPDQDDVEFPAYLKRLAAQRPHDLRERLVGRVFGPEAAPPAGASIDIAAYLARVELLHPGAALDPALRADLKALLDDPPALHDLVVAHLGSMWETALADEWQRERSRPLGLEHQIGVFRQQIVAGAVAAETFRACTGRALPGDLLQPRADVDRIVLSPSAHNGWHVSAWYGDGTLRIFFGAPPNYAALLRSSAIGGPELRARLAALADDARLGILALLAQHHELPAQEIIARLDLSQSSVSRHLKQLIAVGYLVERRGSGANKIYSLGPLSLDGTIRALDQLLAGASAPAARPLPAPDGDHPPELRGLLDAQGRFTRWPTKMRERMLALEYLSGRFEPGRYYSEREVNALLGAQITFGDFATIRRELYNYHFINRERDGSRYWRADPAQRENTQ